MTSLLLRYKFLFLLILLSIITFTINQFPSFIESFYSVGIYPHISYSMRFLLGWLPFSLGDFMYGFIAIWLLVKLVHFFIRLFRGNLASKNWVIFLTRTITAILFIYVLFNWMWAFNYNRLGSAFQFKVNPQRYSNADLLRLTDTLQSKLEFICSDSVKLNQPAFTNLSSIKEECKNDYALATKIYPFLVYQNLSVKKATLGKMGNFLGFLGYINPITLEAQLNQGIPSFLLPYVCCHEMAHQLGYASESEANLIGYITCKQSPKIQFQYSVYNDMMGYAITDIANRDTVLAKKYFKNLPKKVKDDRKAIHDFYRAYKNPISPMVDWMYDRYLKLNNQPHGRESYNEVVGWIIAYAKKYGWDKV